MLGENYKEILAEDGLGSTQENVTPFSYTQTPAVYPSQYDAAHALYDAENKIVKELLDLLDRATGIQIDLTG